MLHYFKVEVTNQLGTRLFPVEVMRYSGGELKVQVCQSGDGLDFSSSWGHVKVTARLQSPEDVMLLLQMTEVIARNDELVHRSLVIPYLPYARSDRVEADHVNFGLRPMANLINSLGYDRVIIYDPHSDVGPALIDNAKVYPQWLAVRGHLACQQWLVDNKAGLVAPDAGAIKKIMDVKKKGQASREHERDLEVLTYIKTRGEKGQVEKTFITSDDVIIRGKAWLVVDDICDGGGTFVPIAQQLKAAGASKVALFVTHGIFRNGTSALENVFDEIFTTNTFISTRLNETLAYRKTSVHVENII